MSLPTTAVGIKATLKDVAPAVEHRIVVPLAIPLDRLHLALQATFGGTNTDRYAFTADGITWACPIPILASTAHRPLPAG